SRKPPSALHELQQRFAEALGAEAALEFPKRPVNLAEGKAIYEKSCASCHGALGMGDGPAAASLNPKPPAIGSAAEMHDRSPALLYRIVSVGIAGTPMVGFAGTLTAEQRWNVISYLTALHGSSASVREGEGIYMQKCISCHGMNGTGDGALARSLSKLPPEV